MKAAADRAFLVELEARHAEGCGGPYADQNLKIYRARVARHDAAQPVAVSPVAKAPVASPKPAAQVPSYAQIIYRIASAAGSAVLPDAAAEAITKAVSVEAFSIECANAVAAARLAASFSSDTPAPKPLAEAAAEALAREIIEA